VEEKLTAIQEFGDKVEVVRRLESKVEFDNEGVVNKL
jgi:hypothetical protein